MKRISMSFPKTLRAISAGETVAIDLLFNITAACTASRTLMVSVLIITVFARSVSASVTGKMTGQSLPVLSAQTIFPPCVK